MSKSKQRLLVLFAVLLAVAVAIAANFILSDLESRIDQPSIGDAKKSMPLKKALIEEHDEVVQGLRLMTTSPRDQLAVLKMPDGKLVTVSQGKLIQNTELRVLQIANHQIVMQDLRKATTVVLRDDSEDVSRSVRLGGYVEPKEIVPERVVTE